ncbi:hypothetical protein RXV86_00810 [Alisedimentitalea sp. MJ-SS2]|uniref:hypothetical protein n=1 Tax=Aliisedimentitalea sp. MJ-SS2 TaxID=3049795 RepID=UPI002906EE3F|nr:hypothetical protein [Alisedimentitalea sp. MJ-SS2]MDU8925914.1 hypothetical protein [Alisedimentitalea sp. MJ-SS2]
MDDDLERPSDACRHRYDRECALHYEEWEAKGSVRCPLCKKAGEMALLKRLHSVIIDLWKACEVPVSVTVANGYGFCAGRDRKELTAVRALAEKDRACVEKREPNWRPHLAGMRG